MQDFTDLLFVIINLSEGKDRKGVSHDKDNDGGTRTLYRWILLPNIFNNILKINILPNNDLINKVSKKDSKVQLYATNAGRRQRFVKVYPGETPPANFWVFLVF